MFAKWKEIFVKLLVISICLIFKRLKVVVSMNLRKNNGFYVKMHLICKNADPKVLKCEVCLVLIIVS